MTNARETSRLINLKNGKIHLARAGLASHVTMGNNLVYGKFALRDRSFVEFYSVAAAIVRVIYILVVRRRVYNS